MKNVFFKGVGIDKDVVHICDSVLIKTFADDLVDICLKRSGSIGETKRHDAVFEMTITGAEGGFVFVSGCDTKPVECVADIDLGEELGAFDAIEEFRNQGQRIPILDGHPIESAIIDA